MPVTGSIRVVLTPNKESLLETRGKELRQKLDEEVPLTTRSAVTSSSRKRMEKFLAEHTLPMRTRMARRGRDLEPD